MYPSACHSTLYILSSEHCLPPLLSHRTGLQRPSITATSHYFRLSCIHFQSFVHSATRLPSCSIVVAISTKSAHSPPLLTPLETTVIEDDEQRVNLRQRSGHGHLLQNYKHKVFGKTKQHLYWLWSFTTRRETLVRLKRTPDGLVT